MTVNDSLPQQRRPRTPGEVIETEFLEPSGRTQIELARALGMGRVRLNEILRGRRAVTVDTALRLERVLGPSAQLWLNLQQRLDLWDLRRRRALQRQLALLEPLHYGTPTRRTFHPRNKFAQSGGPWHARDLDDGTRDLPKSRL